MKIKNLNINKTVAMGIVAGTMILSGCTKVNANSDIYFSDVDDACVKTYYSIGVDDKAYFIGKNNLASAISDYDEYQEVGLRVDEKGNTIAVSTEEIAEGDSVIGCYKEYDLEIKDGTHYKIYIDGAQYAIKEKGYRIELDGVTYDVAKDDVVNAINDSKISLMGEDGTLGLSKVIDFEANPNGGKDRVKSK